MTVSTGKRAEIPFTAHMPRLSEVQKARLRNLERCADRWQEKTGNFACKDCLGLEFCREAWDRICGEMKDELL